MNMNPNSPFALATRLATAMWWEVGKCDNADPDLEAEVEHYRPQIEYVDARSRIIKIWILDQGSSPCCVISTQEMPDGPWDESRVTWARYPMKRARWRFEVTSPTDDCGSAEAEDLDVDNVFDDDVTEVGRPADFESEGKYWHPDWRRDCDNIDDIPF